MKTALIVLILTCAAMMQATVFQLCGGVEFAGSHNWKDEYSTLSMKSDMGYSFSGEILTNMQQHLVGGGLEFTTRRSTDLAVSDDVYYTFIAPYVAFNYNVGGSPQVTPYLVGHIGVSIFNPSSLYTATENGDHFNHGAGIHLALGAEMHIQKRIVLGVFYKIYTGSLSYGGYSWSVNQSNLSMMAGVRI